MLAGILPERTSVLNIASRAFLWLAFDLLTILLTSRSLGAKQSLFGSSFGWCDGLQPAVVRDAAMKLRARVVSSFPPWEWEAC